MPRSEQLTKLGLAMRAKRKELGLTQRDLAQRVNISPKSLCNVEMGNNWPSLQVYLALVKALKPRSHAPFVS